MNRPLAADEARAMLAAQDEARANREWHAAEAARTSALETVASAARSRDTAIDTYRDAVVAAWNAGFSMPAIATAAGVSRQAVRQLLQRSGVCR